MPSRTFSPGAVQAAACPPAHKPRLPVIPSSWPAGWDCAGSPTAAADPFLNPFQTRIDTIFDAGVSLTVPIYNGVKGILQYAFYRDSSTYQFYTYNDNAVSFGLRFEF
jgi:hypothetical protein